LRHRRNNRRPERRDGAFGRRFLLMRSQVSAERLRVRELTAFDRQIAQWGSIFLHVCARIRLRSAKYKTGDPLETFLQQMINGLTLGSVYAIVALGYTMVYGIIQLINFAHGEVVMIGAMVAHTVIVVLTGANTGLPAVVIVLAGLRAAIPVGMGVGYTLERVAYRPLRRAPRLAPLITAIGLSIVLHHLATIVWGRHPIAFPQIVATVPYHITDHPDG